MINLEITPERANELRYALFLHTKHDSIEFPSARVQLIRSVIQMLDIEISNNTNSRLCAQEENEEE